MSSTLSPLYSAWVESSLGAPLPVEAKATCQSCLMLAPQERFAEALALERSPGAPPTSAALSETPSASEPPPGQPAWFNPRTKCCTYIPNLANFLVGKILTSSDPGLARGRASVQERLASGVGVTPLGLAKPRVHALLYDHGSPGFGKAVRLRCPHYIDEAGGLCGIWRHSSAICSTWYCKYDQGGRGSAFWEALRDLLLLLERRLSLWCLVDLGLAADHLQHLMTLQTLEGPLAPHDLDEVRNEAAYSSAWRHLAGREVEHFEACATKVAALSWNEVSTLGGPEVAVLEQVMRDRYQQLSTIPERLKVGPFRVVHADQLAQVIETYSNFDPLRVARVLVDHLHMFDGQRAWREVLAQLEEEFALRMDHAVVQRLVDYGVLVAAG